MTASRFCSTSSWKCSLLAGSVLCWMSGVLVFGLCLSTIRDPVFMPSIMTLAEPVYQSMTVALAGAVCICAVAFVGCCGATCRRPGVLMVYGLCITILFIYQVVDAISILYQKHEVFPSIQFLSVELCKYRKRHAVSGRQGRQLPDEVLVERVSRAESNARRFNHNIELLLIEYRKKGLDAECLPIKDLLTPTAAILLLTAGFYIYFGYCTFQLMQHLRHRDQTERRTRRIKFQKEMSPEEDENQNEVEVGWRKHFPGFFTPKNSSFERLGLEEKALDTGSSIDRPCVAQ